MPLFFLNITNNNGFTSEFLDAIYELFGLVVDS